MPKGRPFSLLCRQVAELTAGERADLHCHSTNSDGRLSPEQLLALARSLKLAVLAITDHDFVSKAASTESVQVIPAVEVSAVWARGDCHILGYGVDAESETLRRLLVELRRRRWERYVRLVTHLRSRGLHVELPIWREDARALGRRLLAQELVASKQVSSVREVFRRLLSANSLPILPELGAPLAEVIAGIRQAGGIAVWAHPHESIDDDAICTFRRLGGEGLECEYPTFRPERRRRLREAAARHSLLVTGGSDSHGNSSQDRRLGSCTIRQADITPLLARLRDSADRKFDPAPSFCR